MPDDASRSRRFLTAGEKIWLGAGCLPVLFFAAATLFMPWFLGRVSGGRVSPGFYIFSAVVIAVMGYQAVQRLRDLLAGEALIVEDRLERSWRSRRGQVAWGRFERLGTLRLRPRALHAGHVGGVNRLSYSPASRIVWSLEPLERVIVPRQQ